MLPLDPGETITTIMPLPEDEKTWGKLNVMFATTSGTRAPKQAFRFRRRAPAGIIAMKLEARRRDRRRADLHRKR